MKFRTKAQLQEGRRENWRRWNAKQQKAIRTKDGDVMFPNVRRKEIPEAVFVERDQRQSAARSLTAIVFGDPPPGYSALDKKRQGIEP